jgi:hypothetical protein
MPGGLTRLEDCQIIILSHRLQSFSFSALSRVVHTPRLQTATKSSSFIISKIICGRFIKYDSHPAGSFSDSDVARNTTSEFKRTSQMKSALPFSKHKHCSHITGQTRDTMFLGRIQFVGQCILSSFPLFSPPTPSLTTTLLPTSMRTFCVAAQPQRRR